MEQEKEQRNWSELTRDILLLIFQMVGILDVLKNAGCVCRSWRKVAKDEPELWSRIDLTKHNYSSNIYPLKNLIKRAIDRSGGRLEEFWIKNLGDDDILHYLSARTSVLKSLRLILCDYISDVGIINTVKKQPLLEELEIQFCWWTVDLPELVGKEIPNLKHFKLNTRNDPDDQYVFDGDEIVGSDEEAFGIAKTMHQLRSLQLISNELANKGLKAILEGCPHLESLDIRRCYNVIMDSDMRARCARLTTLRLPNESLDDYEYKDELGDDAEPINYDHFPMDMYDPTDSDDDSSHAAFLAYLMDVYGLE